MALSKRNQEAWDRLTPEQQAAAERIHARNRTSEAQERHQSIAEAAEKEFPPLVLDETLAGFFASFRLARERAGLSLADIADRTGMDRAAISRLETGKVPNPTWSTLRALANAVGGVIAFRMEIPVAAETKD
jgi:DNA-binding XRE family transcriptional regulator